MAYAMQAALPGLAPDPYRLEPLRPSYSKMCRQLESVARAVSVPVEMLTAHNIRAHAAKVGWSATTIVNLTRVAHAHGIDIDPHKSPRPRSRPSGMMLAPLIATDRWQPPAQQRTAALAALVWAHPAPLPMWRRLTIADLTITEGGVRIPGRLCKGATEPTSVWTDTARRLHPNTPDDRIPFLARMDDSLLPAGERIIQLGWDLFMAGITFDRWRAWAVDNGATPVHRGLTRDRHR